MATTNPVFQVLVTKGDLAPLAKDKTLSELQPGQIGVFSNRTNLSIDSTSAAVEKKEIYLAVGIDRDGDGVTDDVIKSAGQVIQTNNMKDYNLQCYVAPKPKIVEITGFTAKCESEYGLKIEVRNQAGYTSHGYNQIAKSFVVKTSCCAQEDCITCPQGDCNEVAIKLTEAINSDVENLFKAELIAGPGGAVITNPSDFVLGSITTLGTITSGGTAYTDGTHNGVALTSSSGDGTGATATVVVESGVVTSVTLEEGGSGYAAGDQLTVSIGSGTGFVIPVDEANTVECMGIRITTNPMALQKFCAVNLGYYNPRSTNIIVSGVVGFECNGDIVTTQELQNEQGLGYDISQLEYEAGGWNGKPGPYRTSTLAGVPIDSYESYVDKTAKYTEINLGYDMFSVGGWLEYLNNLASIIAIPCTDTTTSTALITILDAVFSQFHPLADSMGECDCLGASGTSDKDPTKNGLG